jgi:ABC-type multidrug transport system fused ATPase/permease subunit
MSAAEKKSPISSNRWIFSYLLTEKKIFIPSLVALFLTAGLALAFPYFLKELIGNPVDSVRNAVPPAEIISKINDIILKLVAVLFLQATIGYFRVQGFIRSGESALNRLRKDLFKHLLHLPMPYFQDQRAGSLSNRVSADLALVRETLLTTVPQAVRQTVILIGGLIFIFISSWKLSLIMLGCIPVVVLLIAIFGRKVRNRGIRPKHRRCQGVHQRTFRARALPNRAPILPQRHPARSQSPRRVSFVRHLRPVRNDRLRRLVRRSHVC